MCFYLTSIVFWQKWIIKPFKIVCLLQNFIKLCTPINIKEMGVWENVYKKKKLSFGGNKTNKYIKF